MSRFNVPAPRAMGPGPGRHPGPHQPPPPRGSRRVPEAGDDDDLDDCPLCCSELDATDRRFKPCHCGYQICAWCWHQLMERAVASHTHGRCPACRTQYDESTIRFSAPSDAELAAESERLRLKKEKDPDGFTTVSKGSNRKQTLNPKPQTLNTLTLMQRKRLFDVRVIRRNLVYVVGVTPRFCHEKQLHDLSIFQKYGAVLKIHATPPKPNSVLPTGSAYVTFDNDQSAALCIRGVDGTALDGKTLRASFGTTKYCTSFLKNIKCVNPNCLYLHDGGEESDSFTKEEMLAQYGAKNTKAFQDAARSAGGVGGAGSAQGNPAGPAILQSGSPHQGVGGYKGNNFNPHYSLGNQTLNQAPGRERFDPGGATGPGSSRGNLFARDDRFGDKKTGNGVRGNGNGENGGFSNGAFHAEPTSGTRGVTRDVRPAGGGGGGHSSSSLRGGIPAPRLGVPVLGTNCGARNGNGGVNGAVGVGNGSDLTTGMTNLLRIDHRNDNRGAGTQHHGGDPSAGVFGNGKASPPPVPTGAPPPGSQTHRERSRFGFAEEN